MNSNKLMMISKNTCGLQSIYRNTQLFNLQAMSFRSKFKRAGAEVKYKSESKILGDKRMMSIP